MTNLAIKRPRDTSTPILPAVAKTRSGVLFEPRAGRWVYRDRSLTVSLNFLHLQKITVGIRASVKATLLWYAENTSAAHLKNMFSHLERFFRVIGSSRHEDLAEITSREILSYRAALSKKDAWYVGSLSGLFQKWHQLGYLGITDEAIVLLKGLRTPGNAKGEAVLTMDIEDGPFTDIEVQAIQSALDRALATAVITLEKWLLVQLYMLLGQRSLQYAALKVRDVHVEWSKDGTPVYMLRVPRAKQRGQLSRHAFTERLLIPQVGNSLVEHANLVRLEYADKVSDPLDAPLFPTRGNRIGEPAGFEFHRTSASLASLLQRTLNSLAVISERTGTRLHITATRFRRTIGTRAAAEGHGELVIAELLDHSDTQNVGVYVQAVPEIIERIDRAVAMQLAPLAQAFAGVLIAGENEAVRGNDPRSRICAPRFDGTMKPMGSCGKHGFCGAFAPIACYTCMNFQPWIDGPHDAVLSYLIAERERLLGDGDKRIASINDRTILAVAEVVGRCEAARSETGGLLP